ncbi:hypothetical protein DUNSADRAFT_13451 [Dunaliella salina]|uniref:Encoded protein n=1 Tax=Dunaliella salina TaxID=3046 RepID=A0ABQ7G9G1_DUNSA|nr:hypothetical protein DUNSADRAFT_13451 [Dunaliella salina]|eukprot:KAF5831214.1 hypothetical protein DUNSADRAFT_13451 [Dunaliella salina]
MQSYIYTFYIQCSSLTLSWPVQQAIDTIADTSLEQGSPLYEAWHASNRFSATSFVRTRCSSYPHDFATTAKEDPAYLAEGSSIWYSS